MDTRAVQQRLLSLGYSPGAVDGRNGPKTKAAVKAFQIAKGLAADGIVGPITEAALFPEDLPRIQYEPGSRVTENVKPIWPRQKDCPVFYGPVGLNQTTLEIPFAMRIAWDKRVHIRRFSIHEKVHDSAKRVFERIADAYDEKARAKLGLDLFGGCLNVRPMRGGSQYSMHSWGIAIDFDPERNQLKWGADRARLAKPDAERFLDLWAEEGWISLGRAIGRDFMHVQAARL